MSELTILITTYNRLDALKITLEHLARDYKTVPICICDDGSTDQTVAFIKSEYPNIKLLTNNSNSGLIYSRNKLMRVVDTPYAISLDDDAHFISQDVVPAIVSYFETHKNCAVVSFRLFWGLEPPSSTGTAETSKIVNSYAGGAHAFRMAMWNQIPDYPGWYRFYGEENYTSMQLFQNDLEVHYYPKILVHHRVEVAMRKTQKDYIIRTVRALHASWSNYLLFYPIPKALRAIASSFKAQLKNHMLVGDWKVGIASIGAGIKLMVHVGKWWGSTARFTEEQLERFQKLPQVPLYWSPNRET